MYTWHKAEGITTITLADNQLQEVTAADKRIALLRRSDTIYAFAAMCPHQGIPLCNGWLDAQGRIVCPEHKYRFDPANGRNTTGEGYKLKTYPVEIRDQDIYIGLI